MVDGFACASVSIFGFDGRFIDLPFAFILGILLGIMHLILAPENHLFSNVFEVIASIVISFLARASGSIMGGSLFCFSTLAQSGIALILPGCKYFTLRCILWPRNLPTRFPQPQNHLLGTTLKMSKKSLTIDIDVILCSALELQTKHLVAGSVRLVYSIFYTFMLGYGITIGSVLYGYMNKHAVSDTDCTNPPADAWSLIFVFIFSVAIAIINQTKWKQLPVMVFISVSGYVVHWQAASYFKGASTVSNTFGALTVGKCEPTPTGLTLFTTSQQRLARTHTI